MQELQAILPAASAALQSALANLTSLFLTPQHSLAVAGFHKDSKKGGFAAVPEFVEHMPVAICSMSETVTLGSQRERRGLLLASGVNSARSDYEGNKIGVPGLVDRVLQGRVQEAIDQEAAEKSQVGDSSHTHCLLLFVRYSGALSVAPGGHVAARVSLRGAASQEGVRHKYLQQVRGRPHKLA